MDVPYIYINVVVGRNQVKVLLGFQSLKLWVKWINLRGLPYFFFFTLFMILERGLVILSSTCYIC
jgi:hypothetical protein